MTIWEASTEARIVAAQERIARELEPHRSGEVQRLMQRLAQQRQEKLRNVAPAER